ncbi:PREDICTED: uncharacterized protein LOC101314059 [Fragaria vesca subsp. vesca]
MAALTRFVSRLTDKCRPFFKLLKNQHCKLINWGPEQDEAFRKIKEYRASVPMLSKPIPREMLYLYLATSDTVVSSALIRKDDVIELLVYYVGKGFTLVLQKPEASGRLAKWVIELGEFDMPRVAIKGQAAAYFISELTPMKNNEVHSEIEHEVSGTFEAKEPHLSSYQALAKALLSRFESAMVTQIPRKENSNADALARLATGTRQKGRKKVKVEILDRPSISKTISEIFAITVGPREPTWMDPIIEFIKEGVRPKNRRQARKLQSRCARYTDKR